MSGDRYTSRARVSRDSDKASDGLALRSARRHVLCELAVAVLESHGCTDYKVRWRNDQYLRDGDPFGSVTRRYVGPIPAWDYIEVSATAEVISGGVE